LGDSALWLATLGTEVEETRPWPPEDPTMPPCVGDPGPAPFRRYLRATLSSVRVRHSRRRPYAARHLPLQGMDKRAAITGRGVGTDQRRPTRRRLPRRRVLRSSALRGSRRIACAQARSGAGIPRLSWTRVGELRDHEVPHPGPRPEGSKVSRGKFKGVEARDVRKPPRQPPDPRWASPTPISIARRRSHEH